MTRQNPIYLDKVERKKLTELRGIKPEYADLDISQIAHLELKETLFFKIRETLKNKSATPRTMPLMFMLVRKLTILSYRFRNKINLYTDF